MDGWKGGQFDGITHRHSHGWVERWTTGWYYTLTQPWMGGKVDNWMVLQYGHFVMQLHAQDTVQQYI